jgi:cell wall-associated NlpC family hydrolase
MGAMAGRLGIAGAAVGAGLLAGHYAQKYIGGGQAGARGAAGSITGNALRGAGIGAGIGTLIEPGIGTAIGGGIGAVAGGIYGWFSRPKHSTGDGQTGGATSGAAAGAGSSGTKATGTMGAGKTGAAAVAVAMKYLGTPYKYGGSTPETGFDCSGLVQWSFKQIGVQLPRVAADQGNSGSAIDVLSVVIGDLIFKALPGKGAHHVAMIAGGGNLIEAAHTGTNIRLRKYDPTEWQFARRVIGAAGSMAVTDGTTAASGGLLASMSYGGDMGDTSVNDAGEASNIAGALSGINGMSSGTSGGMSSTGNGSAATATTNGSTTAGTAGAAMTNSGLKGILQAAGFSGTGLATAYAVAMAESGGKAGAHNPNVKTGDNSYGLFQINMLGQMGANRLKQFGLTSDDQLYDPMTNAKAAYAISSGGKNWGAWTTYKDGAYKQYLNSYAKGTINVAYDQVAQLHAGETVLNKRDAQTVRDALMANNRPSAGSGSSGATVTVGDIYVTVQGVMDTKAASDAANQISKVIKSNLRTENIMSGNI